MMNLYWIVDSDSLLQNLARRFSESLLVLIGFNFVLRIPLLLQEARNFQSWHGNLGTLYRRCAFNARVYIILTVGIFLQMASINSSRSGGGRLGTLELLSWFTSYCLVRWSRIDECPAWEAQMLDNMSGLDYSSCMADSYFNGYLRIILPAKQNQTNKSLRKRIEDFMDKNRIRDKEFPVRSLIILVPKSGKCFPLLSDDPKIPPEETDKIQSCKELEDAILNRAGTKGRPYRAAAYCIEVNGRTKERLDVPHLYAVAEQPTIVQTFVESLEMNMYNAESLKEHKIEIIHKFYRDLKKYIHQSTDCHNLAEVVYYDDNEDVLSVLRSFLIQKSEDQLKRRHDYYSKDS